MKWYVDVLVIGGDVIPIVSMLLMIRKRRRLLKNGLITDGEIVELVEDEGNFYPVICFTAITGEKIGKKYKDSFSKSQLVIGSKMQVYYDPHKPASFIIDTKLSRWLPYVIIGLSFIFLIAYFTFIRK